MCEKSQSPCLPYVGVEAGDEPTDRWVSCLDVDELLDKEKNMSVSELSLQLYHKYWRQVKIKQEKKN